ncbi:uncharacterized protein [Amphiura filiformis]|uniref:uncharacterized protein isoform X2 n=1 Tax=Amphiura filiformis TaxID=82378 RepID=UPI003B22558B
MAMSTKDRRFLTTVTMICLHKGSYELPNQKVTPSGFNYEEVKVCSCHRPRCTNLPDLVPIKAKKSVSFYEYVRVRHFEVEDTKEEALLKWKIMSIVYDEEIDDYNYEEDEEMKELLDEINNW